MNKKINFLSLALLTTILISGCSFQSIRQTVSAKDVYTITLTKSSANIVTKEAEITSKNTTIDMLLKAADVPFQSVERGGAEIVTELDGVLSTASKRWNLYINNQKKDIVKLSDTQIKMEDKIEWKYE